jgi:outer membrane protein insertion porin family/translocation and assembly module TamA
VAKPVTVAFRLVGGMLFPNGYGQTLKEDTPAARDVQLLQFRGFFSGGPNSNRGYAYNGVGRHEVVGFLSPRQDPNAAGVPVPIGGLTLWESSVELRVNIVDSLGATLFVDASDVTGGVTELKLTTPHVSTGLGLRYGTPVGPVRLDVGYRIPCLQRIYPKLCEDALPRDVGAAGFILNWPLAVTLAIGEAF